MNKALSSWKLNEVKMLRLQNHFFFFGAGIIQRYNMDLDDDHYERSPIKRTIEELINKCPEHSAVKEMNPPSNKSKGKTKKKGNLWPNSETLHQCSVGPHSPG